MQGSLALKGGVLYVGRHVKTAHVRAYDLDGRPLGPGFSFRGPARARAAAAGLAVDDDRRVWVADTPADRVRAFNLFGSEVAGVGGAGGEEEPRDAAGSIQRPVGVACLGGSEDLRLTVALGGTRRHAVQVFDEAGRFRASLRPEGRAGARFRRVLGVAVLGRFTYVCEGGARRVQVFRDGEFHFAIPMPALPGAAGLRPEPRAAAPLPDGRLLVACGAPPAAATEDGGSAVLLFDGSGRLLQALAEHGAEEGRVFEPDDVVVEPGARDRESRVVVIDRDGERLQVFNLLGRCYGTFAEEAG